MGGPVDISEEAGVRYLHLGSEYVHGAMRLSRPDRLVLEYTREMLAPLLWQPPGWPRSTLAVGLGAGSFVRFFDRRLPRSRLVVVEIEPAVVAAARSLFRLPPEGPRLRIHLDDGARHLAARRRRYDLILVDGFDGRARAGALEGLSFYQLCRQRLTGRGLLSVNLFGSTRKVGAATARLERAFEGRILALPRGQSGNVVVLAAVGPPRRIHPRRLLLAARRLRSDLGLDLTATVARLRRRRGDDPFLL